MSVIQYNKDVEKTQSVLRDLEKSFKQRDLLISQRSVTAKVVSRLKQLHAYVSIL